MSYALYIWDTDCECWEFDAMLGTLCYADAVEEAKYIVRQCAYPLRWQILVVL